MSVVRDILYVGTDRPPPKHDWGFEVYLASTPTAERKFFETIQHLREHLMECLQRRETVLTFELPVMAWMAVLDELENKREKNISYLLRSDIVDRLNAAIDRIHDEANFMVSFGPSPTVAARLDPNRQRTRRDLASDELKKSLRDKKE
jgi:hypothetical protein